MSRMSKIFKRKDKATANGNGNSPYPPGAPPAYNDFTSKETMGTYNNYPSTATFASSDTRASVPIGLNSIPEFPKQPQYQQYQQYRQQPQMPTRPAPAPAPAQQSRNFSPSSNGSASTGVGSSNGVNNSNSTGWRSFSDKSDKSNTTTNTTPNFVDPGISAADVRRCTKLLRRMFELRLEMWALTNAYESDQPMRIEKKRQLDAVFVDIHNMVAAWQAVGPHPWKPEEWLEIDWIATTLVDLPQW
ncbi:hypothetical protein QBC46DRAFT_151730 [Diplogelasinospora grovesii]|uniref:Uncharacterized protein n=1 Tax=Diplogelasinospora grovesii TaxID=303347 RepID=A0AAN6N565_9PEZI|nr:hypothetical protein QBC46DRAFT_151730 [Diplogelasinospora grovesii]